MNENSPKNEEINSVSVSEEKAVNQEKNIQVEKKKKSKKKIIIPIVIILILVVALFVIYNFMINNSKNVFLRAVNTEYQKLDNKIDELLNNNINKVSTDKTISANYKFDFEVNMNDDLILGTNYDEMLEEINKLNLEMNTIIDNKNKEFSYDINLKSENDSLLNVLAYGQKKNIYIELKDLFDKYIEVPIEEYDAIFEGNETVDDSRYIVKTVKDSFLNHLNEKDFIKTSTKTDINGKKVNTKKITYSLNEKKALTLTKTVLSELKENKKFIEKCASITGKDKEDIKETIEDAINDLKDELEYSDNSDETIELSVYTEGFLNKVVKYELRFISDDEKVTLTYSNYKNVTIIEVYHDDEKLLTSKTTKEAKDTYQTKVSVESIEMVINSKITDTKNIHTYTLTEEESNIKIAGKLSTTNKEVKKNKEYNGNLKLTASVNVEDEELASFVVNNKSVIKIGEDLTLPNFDKSVSYNEITSDDYTTIMNNLNNNKKLMEFITKISSYTDASSIY